MTLELVEIGTIGGSSGLLGMLIMYVFRSLDKRVVVVEKVQRVATKACELHRLRLTNKINKKDEELKEEITQIKRGVDTVITVMQMQATDPKVVAILKNGKGGK